jgi:hypothetical protein
VALALCELILPARTARPAGPLFAGVIAAALALCASFFLCGVGWSWGPRYLILVLPP